MKNKEMVWNVIGWIFGVVVFAIGMINTFWGNDPGFGIFLVLLSFVYLPPVNVLFKKITGYKIPVIGKVLLGVFVLWASLGVGELFDKIEMMKMDL